MEPLNRQANLFAPTVPCAPQLRLPNPITAYHREESDGPPPATLPLNNLTTTIEEHGPA